MSLAPHSIKRFAGLFASTNPYGRIPEGAQSVADNCSLRSSDVLEPRRGFKASASCGAPVNALAFKQGVAVGITYDNQGAGITGTLRKYDPVADAWAALPMNPGALTIDCPGSLAGVDTRFVSAQKALYFQSKYGLTKIEDIASGVCRCALSCTMPVLGGTGVNDNGLVGAQAGVGGSFGAWLLAGNSAAYRVTTCRFGANGELIESAPSDRFVAKNITAGTLDVGVNLLMTPLCPPDAFFRIYRSKQSAGTPSDELFLIAEVLPSSNTLRTDGFLDFAGTFTYTDVTPDSALLVPLYTNAQTGGTVAVANSQAPLSVDMAWFRNRLYFLNTSGRQLIQVRVVGTGVNGGISGGDYFTLSGRRFTFTENAGSSTAGPVTVCVDTNLTVSNNIEGTARNLVTSVNFYFETSPGSFGSPAIGGPLYSQVTASAPTAVGAGGQDSGIVNITSLLPGSVPFSLATNKPDGWDRNYTAGLTSLPNAQGAGLMWSNPGQPEGVPLANNTIIGDPTSAGQRCIALKEALFIFKQDGLWKLTDDGSSLGPLITPVDPTIRLVAPETAVALDNFILALCDQGVVLISETGAVVNISHRQIERELFALMARVGSSTLASLAFGLAYPAEHTYILSLPESSNAGACTRQYVYNLETQAWSSWTVPGVLCGAVHPDTGQLYLGRTDGTIWIERKNYDSTDYQDPGFSIAFPAATPLTATNYLLQSQSFDLSPWSAVNSAVSGDSAIAPDGTMKADTLTAAALATTHRILQQSTSPIASNGTASVYAKAGTINFICMSDTGPTHKAIFDLSLGIVTSTVGTGTVASITSVGNGWYRCVLSHPSLLANEFLAINIGDTAAHADVGVAWLAAGTETILLWGAQLEANAGVTDLIQTTTSVVGGVKTASLIFSGDLRTGSTPLSVGDVIQQFQANALQQRVIAVSYNSSTNQTTISLDNSPRYEWTNGVTLTVVKAIQVKPTFLPLHADEPLQDKEWGDAYLSFRYCDLDFTTVGWTSEKYQMPTGTNPAIERINNADGSVAPIPLQGWGVSSWGGSVWGRQTKDVVLKCTLPEEVGGYSAQLTLGLTLPCGLARFELSAIDVKISGDTTQTTR